MNNKVMISSRIVLSARFIKMPVSTQNLYFHLLMNCENGYVAADLVSRCIGGTADDINILVEKGLIYVDNEYLWYIRDWDEHKGDKYDAQ